jgi:RNA polymerase sigma-70 factor (ECF subfamily)
VATAEEKQGRLEEERELVERCLKGDQSSFAEMVRRFQNMVFNLAYNFLGNPQEAEDLSQEVFLKVFRSLNSFRSDSTLKTWIYRITTNMAFNRIKWLRRRGRNRQISIDSNPSEELPPMSDSLADDAPGPERKARSVEIRIRLMAALDALSDEQKAVVILRDVEGMSYEEIAETLGINIGTVKSRLARGRANIQDTMRDML